MIRFISFGSALVGALLLPLFSAVAHAEEPAAREITVEEFLQSLTTIPGLVLRKDPFIEVSPPFTIPAPENGGDDSSPVAGAPLLERYSTAEYEVVAVLLGDKYPRALLRLPADVSPKRKVVIVKEGDKLGNRKGIISKITSEGLVVQQSQRSKHGFVDKSEFVLRVGGTAEQQKVALSSASLNSETKKKDAEK